MPGKYRFTNDPEEARQTIMGDGKCKMLLDELTTLEETTRKESISFDSWVSLTQMLGYVKATAKDTLYGEMSNELRFVSAKITKAAVEAFMECMNAMTDEELEKVLLEAEEDYIRTMTKNDDVMGDLVKLLDVLGIKVSELQL